MPSKAADAPVALVTGAGKGIGRAVALALAQRGAALALVTRSQGDLDSLVKTLPPNHPCLAMAADAADPAAVSDIVKRAVERFGKVDVLVNNASILTARARMEEVSLNDWTETLRVNLTGPFLFMKALLPLMKARRSGCVLNVTSGAGQRAAPEWGAYTVSKFGLEGLTRASAEEMKPFGVRVIAVNPGGTRTRMRAEAYPKENPLTLPAPEEVAAFFVWLALDAPDINEPSADYRAWVESGRKRVS